MASRGKTALGSSASLTVTAAPAKVKHKETLVDDLRFIWDLITLQPFQKTVTGGVLGTHESIGEAELSPGLSSVSGPAHHSIGGATITVSEVPSAVGQGEYYTDTELVISSPIYEFNNPVELTYFKVTGYWYNIASPPLTGSSNQSQMQVISAFVTLWPGYIDKNGAAQTFPPGFYTFVENLDLGQGIGFDTALALAPIQARILDGQLETIDQGNAPGVQLTANSDILNLAAQGYEQLIYNVQFSNVVYAGAGRVLNNFAFIASPNTTELVLTDPGLFRMPYGGPA